MQPNAPLQTSSRTATLGALLLGLLALVALSPKWTMPLAAWIAPVALLYFYRLGNVKRRAGWLLASYSLAYVVAMYEALPMPLPFLFLFAFQDSVCNLLVFTLDRWAVRRTNSFGVTLVFPAAFVTKEFLLAQTGAGVWGVLANTQSTFPYLTQLAAVTGLWGVSFLVYWFGSVVVWAIEQYRTGYPFRRGLALFGTVLGLTLSWGAWRYHAVSPEPRTVRIAGLIVSNFGWMEALHEDRTGQRTPIHPKTSQNSATLTEVRKAMLSFIENPEAGRFPKGFAAMHRLHDSLFTLSEKAVAQGSKIVTWSEANALVLQADESVLIERGQQFARRHRVYLLMAMGVIKPGPVALGTKFMNNQTVLIDSRGRVLNVFRKNNPVPVAEASVPGDGVVPVIRTPYGKLGISICYDAEFPAQMRQLGQKGAGILLLPSGDWYAIAPFHSYMASLRAIENGCSLVRPVSGGLSVVTDRRGRVQACTDFFEPGEKLMIADVPVGHVPTLYSRIGDAFAYGCLLVTGVALVFMAGRFLQRRKRPVRLPKVQWS